MTPRLVVTLLTILGMAVQLQACANAPVTDERLVEIATPIPLYAATDQVERLAEQRESKRQTLLFRTLAGRIGHFTRLR